MSANARLGAGLSGLARLKIRQVSFCLLISFCLLYLPGEAHAKGCSKVRLSASCNAHNRFKNLRQIRPGRAANGRSASKLFRHLMRDATKTNGAGRFTSENKRLTSEMLIEAPGKQASDTLALLGIPTFPQIPPIIVLFPPKPKNPDILDF